MGKYKRKMPDIEAYQWLKNGDHPLDKSEIIKHPEGDFLSEGKVVRRFRHPKIDGSSFCHCGEKYDDHGFIENSSVSMTVCPGDYVVSGRNSFAVIRKLEFEDYYEEVPA